MTEYRRVYNPNRGADWNYGGAKWRLSRSKIDFFLECPRCFYLDNKLGTKRPSFPSFNLNLAVDELLKREFDTHRAAGTAHPIMQKYGLDAVPFAHEKIDQWRDNFAGVETNHQATGLTVCGAIDDVWLGKNGHLIVVDYKATAKDGHITELSDSSWDKQYQRQLGMYAWLLEQNGFTVAPTGYLVYANASKAEASFNNQLVFETTLVPATIKTDWVDDTLAQIKDCLEATTYPASGLACEYCPYRQAAGKKLQAIHNAQKS